MIDLKELRRRVSGEPTDQGVYGPTWLNPREAMALLGMLEAAEKDSARYRWLCDGNGYFMEERMLCGYETDKDRADSVIDAAMAATKGEQA